MRILFAVTIALAITLVFTHDFKGPLNLKRFNVSTFNVEDQTLLVVGSFDGQLMTSKFEKNKQISNYFTQRMHYRPIVALKRLENKQYISVGKAAIAKWGSELKKFPIAYKKYPMQDTHIQNAAFITNFVSSQVKKKQKQNPKQRFAVNFGHRIEVFNYNFGSVANISCQKLYGVNSSCFKETAYINHILLVYGYEQPIVATEGNTTKNLTTANNDEFIHVSQFISENDNKILDGMAITHEDHLVYFVINYTNSSINISNRTKIVYDSHSDGAIRSVNYCKRKNYNTATNKNQKLETIVLVAFRQQLRFYQLNNKTGQYVHGQSLYFDQILEVQCQEDEAFVLAKNGKNSIIQIVSLEYIYDTKNSSFASFFIVALILCAVFYQIKKYKAKKQASNQVNNGQNYSKFDEVITNRNSYNN